MPLITNKKLLIIIWKIVKKCKELLKNSTFIVGNFLLHLLESFFMFGSYAVACEPIFPGKSVSRLRMRTNTEKRLSQARTRTDNRYYPHTSRRGVVPAQNINNKDTSP